MTPDERQRLKSLESVSFSALPEEERRGIRADLNLLFRNYIDTLLQKQHPLTTDESMLIKAFKYGKLEKQ